MPENYCSRQTGRFAIVERRGLFFAGHGKWTTLRSDAWIFTDGAGKGAAYQLGDGARPLYAQATADELKRGCIHPERFQPDAEDASV